VPDLESWKEDQIRPKIAQNDAEKLRRASSTPIFRLFTVNYVG
jgi:hypothetical protein